MHTLTNAELKKHLDEQVAKHNRPSFIEKDPISIPHQFKDQKDIEIMGFFAAILSWGQRKTIIAKCNELIERMDNEPYNFVMNHTDEDLKNLVGFKHRTMNDTDLLYFIDYFKNHYTENKSLESAFIPEGGFTSVENSLIHFEKELFNSENAPKRSRKHVASPAKGSACKRMNMFLRWMVRNDHAGVDFGIWNSLAPSQLSCPLDVHSGNVARKLKLLKRKQNDGKALSELDTALRSLDNVDPVKYDFALFGLGVFEGF